MKTLLLICALSGLGWFGLERTDATQPSAAQECPPAACAPADCKGLACDPDDCVIEATCTPEGTCILTCTDGSGESCTVEVDCEEVGCDPGDCPPADCVQR